jgi:hypothetical protein
MSRARNRHSRPYRLRQIRDDYCTERRILHHSLNTSTAHEHIDRDTNLQNLLHNISQHSIAVYKYQLPPLRIRPSSKHISLQTTAGALTCLGLNSPAINYTYTHHVPSS